MSGELAPRDAQTHPVGDAEMLLTAPLCVARDPLKGHPHVDVESVSDHLVGRSFSTSQLDADRLLRGTLTYQSTGIHALHLEGTPGLRRNLEDAIAEDGAQVRCKSVLPSIFPDGYGAISIRFSVEHGWEAPIEDLPYFSPGLRESTTRTVRDMVLSELTETYRHLLRDDSVGVELPYFNLTYMGRTPLEDPGCATLRNDVRQLVYPDQPEPLRSSSPFRTEFFYAGYAYLLLFGKDVFERSDQYALLLKTIDVSYFRLVRYMESARRSLAIEDELDVDYLKEISLQLHTEYQSIVSPVFTFDHHSLLIRNEIFRAWDLNTLNRSCQILLDTVRERTESKLLRSQKRRDSIIQGGLALVSAFSLIEAIQAVIELWERWS